MTVDENGGLTWTCGNCVLTWSEPYCSICGRDLKAADLTTNGTAVSGAPAEEAPLTADKERV